MAHFTKIMIWKMKKKGNKLIKYIFVSILFLAVKIVLYNLPTQYQIGTVLI
jgi:hypothetical protein